MRRVRSSSSGHTALNFRANVALELMDRNHVTFPFQLIPLFINAALMQHTARIADRITVIRSMSHQFTNHIAGTYVTMTGSNNQPDQDR